MDSVSGILIAKTKKCGCETQFVFVIRELFSRLEKPTSPLSIQATIRFTSLLLNLPYMTLTAMTCASHITPNPLVSPPALSVACDQQTVLLVEDDAAMQRFLEVALRRAGFRVITAGDGAEAIETLERETIHAIITDAMLPRLGGREMCRFLRRQPRFARIPTLLLTGLLLAPDEIMEGVDAWLQKPVEMKTIVAQVKELLTENAASNNDKDFDDFKDFVEV